MHVQRPMAGLIVVDGALSPEDVTMLAAIVDELEFEEQDVGRNLLSARTRAAVEDPRIPQLLWARVEGALPPVSEFFDAQTRSQRFDPPGPEWEAMGCNPRTRVYRYPMGAGFPEHDDEPWWPTPDSRTFLTVLVYLDVGDCVGGETVVDGEVVAVVEGRVVVFDHLLRHEGRPVERGRKTVIRSDIVARRES
jgi:hypothetical protein